MAAAFEHRPGAEVADGRYRLERVLGRGGMAAVWLASDERLKRPVAIKVIADTLAWDADYLRRFGREARLAAEVAHPNVVAVYDYSATARPPFLVMEYVDAGTLGDRLSAGETFAPDEVAAITRDVLSALEAIHGAGILHRDVKPANVLVGNDGRIRLTDFGIAHADDTTRLTQTGQVIGTLRYLAPEVAEGRPPTERSDLYSVGRLAGELGRGQNLPPALRALADSLVSEDPRQRPLTARHALELLDPSTAVMPPRSSAPRSAPRRSPPPALLGALALIAALAVILVAALGSGSAGSDGSGTDLEQRFDRIERLVQSSRR